MELLLNPEQTLRQVALASHPSVLPRNRSSLRGSLAGHASHAAPVAQSGRLSLRGARTSVRFGGEDEGAGGALTARRLWRMSLSTLEPHGGSAALEQPGGADAGSDAEGGAAAAGALAAEQPLRTGRGRLRKLQVICCMMAQVSRHVSRPSGPCRCTALRLCCLNCSCIS